MNLSGGVDRLQSRFGRERWSGTGGSRGQTPVDYLVGISLVLVTILGTFALVPTVFDPFEPAVSPEKQSMADRLADDLVSDNTYPGTERTVNRTTLEASLEDDFDVLRVSAGITEQERVNVTVQNGTGTTVVGAGDSFDTGAGGEATSVRTFAMRDRACADGCQLIVRVWN